jgi:hypothetical protein
LRGLIRKESGKGDQHRTADAHHDGRQQKQPVPAIADAQPLSAQGPHHPGQVDGEVLPQKPVLSTNISDVEDGTEQRADARFEQAVTNGHRGKCGPKQRRMIQRQRSITNRQERPAEQQRPNRSELAIGQDASGQSSDVRQRGHHAEQQQGRRLAEAVAVVKVHSEQRQHREKREALAALHDAEQDQGTRRACRH